MKKIAIALVFALAALNSQAQSSKMKYEYAIVTVAEGRPEIMIYFGNGKVQNFLETKSIKLARQLFGNSDPIVEALNYMDEQGYELASTCVGVNTGATVVQYIFRRERLK